MIRPVQGERQGRRDGSRPRGAEPAYSKALERGSLWKEDRVKSYGPKTLLALLGPTAVAAKQAAKQKAAAKKAAA